VLYIEQCIGICAVQELMSRYRVCAVGVRSRMSYMDKNVIKNGVSKQHKFISKHYIIIRFFKTNIIFILLNIFCVVLTFKT
jgi:hypothetical protein